MEPQQFWHLSVISTWIFVFPSVCSGVGEPKIHLESRVFVALTGEGLNIGCELRIPANQSRDILTCSDPSHKQIYSCNIKATGGQPERFAETLKLENLTKSGDYHCQYQTAKVYWFLRVRDVGYKEHEMLDYTEVILVTVFTGVLLVFSVVGSVYVFRGHWKECASECGNSGRKRKQNRKEGTEREPEEDSVDVITAPSTSFYASLEPRPRSIYDVLDHSAANREQDQSKAKPQKEEPQKTMAETTQHQHEDLFESVYENFE